MREYKGSFTVEAACVIPLIFLCICIAIESGITLHSEVKNKALLVNEEETVNIVSYMYRKELIEKVLGVWYED